MTSRLTNGRSSAELPTSRRVSTQLIADFMSSGCESALASIRIGSEGCGPDSRSRPLLFGCVGAPNRIQLFCGRPYLTTFSGVDLGNGPKHANRSGPSLPAVPVSQNIAD